MSYHVALGQPGWHPGGPGGLPGPISRAAGPVGPTMPTSIFPTHTRVGDVVTITGPFGGLAQGQVRVRFRGTSWLSPQMMGPGTASVVVPRGAQTGLCEVEVNGRRTGGSNCIIDQGVDRVGRPSHKGRSQRAWTQKGQPLSGLSTQSRRLWLVAFAVAGYYLYDRVISPKLGKRRRERKVRAAFKPGDRTSKAVPYARQRQLRNMGWLAAVEDRPLSGERWRIRYPDEASYLEEGYKHGRWDVDTGIYHEKDW